MLGLVLGVTTGPILDNPTLVVRVKSRGLWGLAGLDLQLEFLFVLHGAAGPVPVGWLVLALEREVAILEASLAPGHARSLRHLLAHIIDYYI